MPIILGNKNAPIKISLVTNPFCGYCKEAHQILEKLLKKYPNSISAQIRFNYFENSAKDEELTQLISNFYKIWKTKSENEFLKSIENWFIKKTSAITVINENIDLSEVIKIGDENRNLGFSFTPVFFINGYQFPNKYDREDIFYFVDDLLEDDDIVNEKV